ncbi:MAG: ABC-type nitrate/sulfonate/bicarbonate transport system, ATPase component [Clostridia bacterium]|jgi:NitT/TauT family transport system ATP-binding protein|nr:ABC-type nitrate/sulfonate/bicarbonate transport system, ATPase component [Clostridia bacterium]
MIELKEVNKSFKRDQDTLKVLENISFTVEKGEILCILGASGSGKSTLLRLMGGFDFCDSGSISIGSEAVVSPSPDSILIFQDFNQLLPWKTVLQNVIYPMKVNKKYGSEQQRRDRAMEYLEMVQLADFYNAYPHQLSGGMKQRAAIARALALEPSILLMDEPFGSLDALTRQSLQELLLQIWKRAGVTIIFVTHDIQEAIILADRIIVMDNKPGRIKDIVQNSFDRPRDISGGDYLELYHRLYSMLSV